jgi:hypothetical protein
MVSDRLFKALQVALVLLSSLLTQTVCAQNSSLYPERPVRLLVGFQAGAATDTLARIIGQHLSERLKQTFVIENKPGAATRIAMEALSKASPDGYTLAVANAVTTMFPTMFVGMSFEPNKDFVPITLLGRSPSFVAVKASLPAATYQEFVAFAKGAKLAFGHPGNGTNPHVAGVALGKSLGIDLVEVPFKGNQPVAAAMAAGEIDYAMLEYESARPLVERGAIKLLAVTEPKRYSLRPEISTGREVGMTLEIEGLTPWFILLAPPGLPASVVSLLNREVREILKISDVQERLLKIGIEAESSTTAEAANYFMAHRAKMNTLLERLQISIKN